MKKTKYLLAIESSCDDTSIAIYKNNELVANQTMSSTSIHKQYGGIVPELAARSHCEVIDKVCIKALDEANINIEQITNIAYTALPGLVGSLHIAKVFANQLGAMLKIKPQKINHMHGHIFSYFIDHDFDKKLLPAMALIISGGHTFIAKITKIGKIEILNSTSDDAVGETLDKVGRFLGLEYPGGISIDEIFDKQKTIKIINHSIASDQFSFSGIKTASLNLINKFKQNKKMTKQNVVTIASSLLQWINDDLLIKLDFYLEKNKKIKSILLGGGVSANNLIRNSVLEKYSNNFNVLIPTKKFTNDNAAMIGKIALLEKNKY